MAIGKSTASLQFHRRFSSLFKSWYLSISSYYYYYYHYYCYYYYYYYHYYYYYYYYYHLIIIIITIIICFSLMFSFLIFFRFD